MLSALWRTVTVFVLGYQLSFSDTFTLISEIKVKEEKLNWLKEKEKELPALKSKMAEFERAYSKGDSSAVRDKLTAYISDFAEKIIAWSPKFRLILLLKTTN